MCNREYKSKCAHLGGEFMRIDSAQLAYELARREWQHKRLAELAGVSRATISAVTGGKRIAPDTAQKIAKALNMPMERLIKGAEK